MSEWKQYPERAVLAGLTIDAESARDNLGHRYDRLNEAHIGVWRCHVCGERRSGAGYRAAVHPDSPNEAILCVYVCTDHERRHLKEPLRFTDPIEEEELAAV